jgi:hypothetical protein
MDLVLNVAALPFDKDAWRLRGWHLILSSPLPSFIITHSACRNCSLTSDCAFCPVSEP